MNRLGFMSARAGCEERGLDFFAQTYHKLCQITSEDVKKSCDISRIAVAKLSRKEKDALVERAMEFIKNGKEDDKARFLSEKPAKAWDTLTKAEKEEFINKLS